MTKSIKHFFIPDPQCKPTSKTSHLTAAGNYVVAKQPDVIVAAGDWFDMPSLSIYDRGKKKAEGKRYIDDIKAGKLGMAAFMQPIIDYNNKVRKYNRSHDKKRKLYKPRLVFLLGNHEERIIRHVNANAELEGQLSYDDLDLEKYGWEVHDFLEVVVIDGIAYSHYFYTRNTGKPYGGTAASKLNNIGFSYVQGHVQGKDMAIKALANGKTIRGTVAGSFYQHEEGYKGPQAQNDWMGCLMFHEVEDGNYSMMEITMKYLLKYYQ